jgi:paxillin
MVWHRTCLGCNVCGRDFGDPQDRVFEGEDGFAYCDICHAEKFAVKCGACGEAIEGQCVEAMDKKWHPDHFACGLCKKPFDGQFFPGDDGKPYCEQHYYEAMGMLCVACKKPILTGKCVTFLDKKYHPEHFKCTYCKKNLVGEQYYKKEGKPYCQKCDIALFG